ncbi:uncharacterized protein LOC115598515 [Calypte anna]|uniref:uncharacterized protein LOC115598515 n=1 Tax=Calypte anna TaxID=9244 RepID=UPI0011C43CFB|nr:uncharacterized protein LOC115598515 [Calypte anna]
MRGGGGNIHRPGSRPSPCSRPSEQAYSGGSPRLRTPVLRLLLRQLLASPPLGFPLRRYRRGEPDTRPRLRVARGGRSGAGAGTALPAVPLPVPSAAPPPCVRALLQGTIKNPTTIPAPYIRMPALKPLMAGAGPQLLRAHRSCLQPARVPKAAHPLQDGDGGWIPASIIAQRPQTRTENRDACSAHTAPLPRPASSAVDGQKIEKKWILSIAEKQCELEQTKYQSVPSCSLLGDSCSNQSCGRGHDEVSKMH